METEIVRHAGPLQSSGTSTNPATRVLHLPRRDHHHRYLPEAQVPAPPEQGEANDLLLHRQTELYDPKDQHLMDYCQPTLEARHGTRPSDRNPL